MFNVLLFFCLKHVVLESQCWALLQQWFQRQIDDASESLLCHVGLASKKSWFFVFAISFTTPCAIIVFYLQSLSAIFEFLGQCFGFFQEQRCTGSNLGLATTWVRGLATTWVFRPKDDLCHTFWQYAVEKLYLCWNGSWYQHKLSFWGKCMMLYIKQKLATISDTCCPSLQHQHIFRENDNIR